MDVSVIDRENYLGMGREKALAALAEKILRYMDLPERSQVCLSFVSDGDMRELNRRYRKLDRTTDVLSFAQRDVGDVGILGDVVISYDTAVRNSQRFSVTVEGEIRRLVVHGILHLLGFDHAEKGRERLCGERKARYWVFSTGKGRRHHSVSPSSSLICSISFTVGRSFRLFRPKVSRNRPVVL